MMGLLVFLMTLLLAKLASARQASGGVSGRASAARSAHPRDASAQVIRIQGVSIQDKRACNPCAAAHGAVVHAPQHMNCALQTAGNERGQLLLAHAARHAGGHGLHLIASGLALGGAEARHLLANLCRRLGINRVESLGGHAALQRLTALFRPGLGNFRRAGMLAHGREFGQLRTHADETFVLYRAGIGTGRTCTQNAPQNQRRYHKLAHIRLPNCRRFIGRQVPDTLCNYRVIMNRG